MTDQRLKVQTALCSPNQGASGQRVLSKCWKVVQIAVVGLICRRIAVLIALVVLIAVLKAGQRCMSNLGLLAIALKQPDGLRCQEAQVGLAPPGVVDLVFKHAEKINHVYEHAEKIDLDYLHDFPAFR